MQTKNIELAGLRFSDNRAYGGEGDIKILAEDIKQNGLINPITVKLSVEESEAEGANIFEVVAGRRRVRAVTMLDWKQIPCRILEGDEIERAEEIAGAENINRLAMHPLDEAAIFKKLLENGEPIEELAQRFDRSVSAIWQRIQLLGLDDNIKTMFRQGILSLQSAAMLNSTGTEGQNLFYEKFKDSYRVKQKEEIPQWEVTGFVSGLNNDRLFKFVSDKQCESCKTRTYFTDVNLFPELSSTEDSCLNHECYMAKWINLLKRKIKSLKGEAPSHADTNIIVTGESNFRKIFGKTVTVDGVEYKILHDHWETRAEKEGKNTFPVFSMTIGSSGKLFIEPAFRKDPKTEKSKTEKSQFAPIVNLLDLPKDETAQTIAAFESKVDPKKSWENTAGDVELEVRRKVLDRLLEMKAEQPDNEKDIDHFLGYFFIREDDKTILKRLTGMENYKDARKLSWPKLFALMYAVTLDVWSLPNFENIAALKKHDITEWVGISMDQLREMYREEIKARIPQVKQVKAKPEKPDNAAKKKKTGSGKRGMIKT